MVVAITGASSDAGSEGSGIAKSSAANAPPALWPEAKAAIEASAALLSRLVGCLRSAVFGTTTRVSHLGQGTVVPPQRVGTWSRARQRVQRKSIGIAAPASGLRAGDGPGSGPSSARTTIAPDVACGSAARWPRCRPSPRWR